MSRSERLRASTGRGEAGASLVLALAFLLVVSAVVAILTNWATNDLQNTHQFSNVRLVHLVETDVLNLDLSLVRTTPSACTPLTPFAYTVDSTPVDVWCNLASSTPLKSQWSRTVKLWSCLASVGPACESSATPISIKAVVEFDDYTSGVHVPTTTPCAPPLVCGTGMKITEWTVR